MTLYAGIDGGQCSTTALVGDGTTILGVGKRAAGRPRGRNARLRAPSRGARRRPRGGARGGRRRRRADVRRDGGGHQRLRRGRIRGRPRSRIAHRSCASCTIPRSRTRERSVPRPASWSSRAREAWHSATTTPRRAASFARAAGAIFSATRAARSGSRGRRSAARCCARIATNAAASAREPSRRSGVPSLRAVQHAFAHGELGRPALAAFASEVLACAADGDADAVDVCAAAAAELADLAATVDARLEPVSLRLVSTSGGLFADDAFLSASAKRCKRRCRTAT